VSAPQVRTPADVAALRLWLLEQWRPDKPFGRLAAQAIAQRAGGDPHVHARWELEALRGSTLWWVSEDMVDLLMAATPSVPADVMPADLLRPSHAGLVVFAKPVVGTDSVHGGACVLDAVVWGGTAMRAGRGRAAGDVAISVSSYRCLDFDAGLSAPELELALQSGSTLHAQPEELPVHAPDGHQWTTEDQVPMDDEHDRSVGLAGHDEQGRIVRNVRLHGASWAPLGRSDWPLDCSVSTFGLGYLPGDPAAQEASAQEDRRLLAALWTLLAQEGLATTTTHVVPRQERRRAERAGVSAPSNVQVVTLRKLHRTRPEGEPEEHHERYSHRWTVTGHWRNQPVGPGRSERRLTWVRPHVKGPEDAPLVVKERVNAWVR